MKIPRISPGIIFAVKKKQKKKKKKKKKTLGTAVPWYKLSLLHHLNILDRQQSIRIKVIGIKRLFN